MHVDRDGSLSVLGSVCLRSPCPNWLNVVASESYWSMWPLDLESRCNDNTAGEGTLALISFVP